MKKIAAFFILVGMLIVGVLTSFTAAAFEPFKVQSIKVEGLRRVSREAVINELPICEGQDITEEDAREAIRALFQLGFFKDVSLAREGNVLIIRVVERPSISKVIINGIKDKDKKLVIIRDVGIAEGRLYDPAVLAAAQRALEKEYFSKGKYGVRIVSCVTEDGPSLMQVKFDIYEGDVAKIKQIKIVGNTAFTEKELIKDFYSSKTNVLSWFSQDDHYAKEKLNADLETLRSFYLDRGYVQMRVDSAQVSLTPDKKDIYITIHITEGDKYCFGKVTIEGDCTIPRERLCALITPVQSGDTFSRKKILDVQQAIIDCLGSEGYSLAEIQPQDRIHEAERLVDINYHVIPGKRVYVRRIDITGNATTQDEVLRRELPQMEGTRISTVLIKEGKERILGRGYAKEIDVDIMPVPGTPDQVDVLYKIDEARLSQISAGLGYSASETLMLNFGIRQENFLGTGKLVDFTVDYSKASSNVAFGYQDPYFTIDGIGMGFSAYYNKSHLSKTTRISDYTTDTYGADLRFAFPLGRHDALNAGIGYDYTHLKIDRSAAAEIICFTRKHGYNFPETYVDVGWRFNNLNQRIFPTCGVTHNIGLKAVLPGAKLTYYRAVYDFSWFYPLSRDERWVFNMNGALGFGDGYGRTRTMPFYRNFFAGGSRFVRGFEENSLGPRDSLTRAFGGNALAAGTIALIFPNPIKPDIKSIRTALFLDAGQVYDTHNRLWSCNGVPINHKVNGFRYSVGVSVSWNSPFGLLTVSLAQPLNAKPGDRKQPIAFSMGTSTNF